MELTLGSNVFRNSNGILKIHGKEQCVLELKPEENLLLLTMDFYDGEGARIGHIRRNVLAFDPYHRFDVASTPPSPTLFQDPPWLMVTDTTTAEVVFQVSAPDKDRIVVSQAKFYSHTGLLVEITTHFCRVPGIPTMFRDVMDVRGGTVTLS
ncbi:MAG: hypothetical protein ACREI3_05160 [Nitrospirales bacterium]